VSESIAIKTVFAKIAIVSKIRNCLYRLKCRIVRKVCGQREKLGVVVEFGKHPPGTEAKFITKSSR